jgi:hypothetical protein
MYTVEEFSVFVFVVIVHQSSTTPYPLDGRLLAYQRALFILDNRLQGLFSRQFVEWFRDISRHTMVNVHLFQTDLGAEYGFRQALDLSLNLLQDTESSLVVHRDRL